MRRLCQQVQSLTLPFIRACFFKSFPHYKTNIFCNSTFGIYNLVVWTRVGVLNSFLRLSNTPTLVLWGRALIFQAFSFLMHSSVIHIVKMKDASLVVEKQKTLSFEPFVQISLSALSFAHGAIRTYPVSCS